MLVVSIGYGLGNQMFEYAYVQKLRSLYPDYEILIDTEYAIPKAHNGYELNRIFWINERQCTIQDFYRLSAEYPHNIDNKGLFLFIKYIRKIQKHVLKRKKSYIRQGDYTEFFPELLKFDKYESFYIHGVFANEKNFEGIEEKIKKIYTFPNIEDKQNLYWKHKIENGISVSVHIRRGDYIDLGLTLLGDEYYEQAISVIRNACKNQCEFYVFTDDVEWAREKYKDRQGFYVVTGNKSENCFRDMQLMSLCKHNIVANSSFSFWGAYLNSNPAKIVVASKEPFDGCVNSFASKDWILI